jgi:flagellar assembly protein FliH
MGRVLKFTRSETGGATPFDRDFLEEFPDAPSVPMTFAAAPEPEADEPPPLDPDEIREGIMAAARADAEAKVKEAYQEGLARGTEAGRKQFEVSIARSADAVAAAAEAIQTAQARFLDGLEPQVIALVKRLVARVIDVELKTNPEVLQHTVRRALAQMAGQYAVTLHLNAADLEAIRVHEIALLDSLPGVESLTLAASEEVEPGGCIARSAHMEVDARLESMLAQILDTLTE